MVVNRKVLVAVTIAVVSIVGAFTGAVAQPNGFPQPRCSRPADQEALRLVRLADAVRQSRAAAERDPLLWADVGYYEAELKASRSCVPTVASR